MEFVLDGGSYEKRVRETLVSFPEWFVLGARVSRVSISSDPEVVRERSVYRHKTRDVLLSRGIGAILRKVLSHEFSHGIDDGEPMSTAHRFSRSENWMGIWRQAGGFAHPKYRDSPQEYFADSLSSAMVYGLPTYRLAHPYEAAYILEVVIPTVREESRNR